MGLYFAECPFEELSGECHVLGDIGLKVAGARLPVVGGVPDTAGQEDKFVRIDRWKDAILGVTTDHTKAVNKHPDKEVGLAQHLAVLSGHHSTIDKRCEGLHGVGGPQDGEALSVFNLEILDGVLNVNDPALAVLQVHGVSFHELLQLLTARIENDRWIQCLAAIDIVVAMDFHPLPEIRITGDMAQFDQRLAFKWCGKPLATIVLGDFIEGIRERALSAVRPKADIHMEDAFLFRFDPLKELVSQPFKVFAVVDGVFPAGPAGISVDEQDLDVGGIAQLFPRIFPSRGR